MAWYWMTGRHPPPPRTRVARAAAPASRRRSRPIRPSASSCRVTTKATHVREVFAALDAVDYPDFEMIGINDGSRDETGAILDELAGKYDRLRVVHLAHQPRQGARAQRGRDCRAPRDSRGHRRRLAPRPRRGHVVRPPLPVRRHARGADREPAHPQPIVAARPAPGRRVLRHRRADQARPDALRLRVHRVGRGLRIPQAGLARRPGGGRLPRSPTTWT